MVTIDAIIVGAGSGSRFSTSTAESSGSLPKQFQMLGPLPVFLHSVSEFLRMGCFRQIVVAVPENFIDLTQEQIHQYLPVQSKTIVRVIAGGARRQDSSYLALQAIEELHPLPSRVLIHDACRPYFSAGFLERIRSCLYDRSYGAWIPVVPIVDTLKKVDNNQVVETVDRNLIRRVQTPQIFEFAVIRSLVDKVRELSHLNFTDDASLCEYFGIPVGVFEGDQKNIKLTYDFELENIRTMMENQKDTSCAPASDTIFTV